MLNEIIYKLPKDVEGAFSQDIKERALAYMSFLLFGQRFYVPITKQVKKSFKIIRREDKLYFSDFDSEMAYANISRDILQSVYLQVRDRICGEIEQKLDQELKEGFSKLFENYLSKRIRMDVDKKMLERKDANKEKSI